MLGTLYNDNHLCQRIIRQFHHKVNMVILLFREILISLTLAIDSTRKIITAITDTLNFSYFTKHCTNLKLTLRTQTPVRHLVQIIGYLQLHIITDILIFFDTAEQLIIIIVLIRMQQVLYHIEHTVSTFRKQMNFLACLQNGKLRCRKHATGNEAETIFLISFFLRNDGTNRTLYQFYKPDQQQYIADIKASMESR